MIPGFASRRRFADLSEAEILALAISSEEDDGRIYASYAERLRAQYPSTAAIFDGMAAEENEHRRRLIEAFERRFGRVIPLIRREHVAGFYSRRPVWLIETLPSTASGTKRRAWRTTPPISTRARPRPAPNPTRGGCSAIWRRRNAAISRRRSRSRPAISRGGAREKEDDQARRQFVLTWVQPGLAGLMDGSVSTLAPIFATAFATQDPWTTFLVGLAASVGAGISMGFTEAAHDDGVISGRGSPVKRGLASGIMTTIGGLGHALPYLIPHFWTATAIAGVVVFIELWAIAWIQNRFMETPFLRAAFQVVLGGFLVLAAGVLIGGS